MDISNLENSRAHYLDMGNADPDEDYSFPGNSDFSSYNYKVYGRIVEDENHYKHLQYYLFYPFQRWFIMNHEGDWELVQVTLNPSDKIESVTYFFNMFKLIYYGTDDLEMIDSTHPAVYIGKGSHNNYAGV